MAVVTLALTSGRPLLDVFVSASGPALQRLNTQGTTLPELQPATAILDTGAGSTCVDYTVLRALSLLPESERKVLSPTTGPIPVTLPTYMVGLIFSDGTERLILSNLRVLATDLSTQGV